MKIYISNLKKNNKYRRNGGFDSSSRLKLFCGEIYLGDNMKMIMKIHCCKVLEAKEDKGGNLVVVKNRSSSSSGYEGYWSWGHDTGNVLSFCFGNRLPWSSACFGIIK